MGLAHNVYFVSIIIKREKDPEKAAPKQGNFCPYHMYYLQASKREHTMHSNKLGGDPWSLTGSNLNDQVAHPHPS